MIFKTIFPEDRPQIANLHIHDMKIQHCIKAKSPFFPFFL